MPARYLLLLTLCSFTSLIYAQSDTASKAVPDVFQKIMGSVKDYKPDTSAAPDDKITRKIIELRNLKGGFNINEAIDFKIAEDRQKGEIPKAEMDKVAAFFQSGNGKRWLDNAVIWIYRNHFTYKELKQLVKFYGTSAGQKMATDFAIIMLQSLRAAEMIKNIYEQQSK